MSNASPPRPPVVAEQRRFVVVASKFNATYVEGLIDHATQEFRKQSPQAKLVLHRVPGAFEIPIVVREIASRKKADAIVAVGVILKGETDHAENLAGSVTNALQRIALEYGVPVINCVLSLENEKQARARCLEGKINRGSEAARAAVEIAAVVADLEAER
ncbi:MAG TPA: 6,7-dimethyl-8-ribityllumazine synthase [Chthoniobacterales bacterium]|jgi:6,7-dimethyl-8-ribityllumazine synthase